MLKLFKTRLHKLFSVIFIIFGPFLGGWPQSTTLGDSQNLNRIVRVFYPHPAGG